MEKPQLGEWRTIKATFRKTGDGRRVYWNRTTWGYETGRAMFIGTRQVYAGEIIQDWDTGYIEGFKRTAAYNVWLFVLDGKRNPVYVLPEDVD